MDIETALRQRRSIRLFKPDPIPQSLIRDMLDEARWSPSWANTQSWRIWVLTGDPLDRFKTALVERSQGWAPSTPDLLMPGRDWPPEYASRTDAMRGAMPTSPAPATRSSDLFGAPCLLIFGIDTRLVANYACLDAGLFVQSLCLSAFGKGLGTCVMAMSVRFPDLIRTIVPGTENHRLVVGVALGYPDAEAPINTYERSRVEISEFVSWVE